MIRALVVTQLSGACRQTLLNRVVSRHTVSFWRHRSVNRMHWSFKSIITIRNLLFLIKAIHTLLGRSRHVDMKEVQSPFSPVAIAIKKTWLSPRSSSLILQHCLYNPHSSDFSTRIQRLMSDLWMKWRRTDSAIIPQHNILTGKTRRLTVHGVYYSPMPITKNPCLSAS